MSEIQIGDLFNNERYVTIHIPGVQLSVHLSWFDLEN